MAGTTGHPTDHLIDAVAADPPSFDFFMAVRRLQAAAPARPRVGYSQSPAQDPLRFAQSPALDFAPSTLEALRRDPADPVRPPTLYSRHFGLFGPHGALPICLTEYAHDRILHHGDRTFAAFCNVFHHRMTSLFFRAWADAHKAVDLDRAAESSWRYFIGSLIGLGGEAFLERDSIPDQAKLFYAGRLAQQTRNAEGLRAILQEFFGVAVELRPFVGRWMNLPREYQCRLGDSSESGTLGRNAIVGTRVWESQLHFRLRVGPMHLTDLERLLPGGGSFRRLRDFVRLYTSDQFTWDAQFVLARDEVPAVQLGRTGRLGWTTWLKTRPFDHDADDIIVDPQAMG